MFGGYGTKRKVPMINFLASYMILGCVVIAGVCMTRHRVVLLAPMESYSFGQKTLYSLIVIAMWPIVLLSCVLDCHSS